MSADWVRFSWVCGGLGCWFSDVCGCVCDLFCLIVLLDFIESLVRHYLVSCVMMLDGFVDGRMYGLMLLIGHFDHFLGAPFFSVFFANGEGKEPITSTSVEHPGKRGSIEGKSWERKNLK